MFIERNFIVAEQECLVLRCGGWYSHERVMVHNFCSRAHESPAIKAKNDVAGE
jgi:hypothetical protein